MKDTQRKKIIRNAVVCMDCNDLIVSHFRHDFKYCKCGAIFVDGGNDYLRCGGDLDKIIPLYKYADED